MLAPRIAATGLLSWPTLHAGVFNDGEEPTQFHSRQEQLAKQKFSTPLAMHVKTWPTPRSEDSESCGNHPGAVDSLTGATRQWATPNARDDHNPSTPDSPRTARKLEQGWTIDLNEQAAWWTTPQAHDAAGGNPERVGRFGTKHGGANLADDVTLWKTPDVPNGGRTMSAADVAANGATDKGKRQVGLENQARFANFAATQSTHPPSATVAPTVKEKAWPTPKSRDSKSAEGEAGMMRQSPDLNVIACRSSLLAPETPTHGSESLPSGPTSRRRLNPNFVDWLMSLPPGWTDYAPVETASWYSRVRMRLECLLNERG